MERTTVTQNSEGGGIRKSPQRNLPEQRARRYAVGGKGRRKGRGRGKEGAGKGGKQARGLVCRDFQDLNIRGWKEALQGRLYPAKEKITKEDVHENKIELRRTQRKGKKGQAGQVF